MEITALSIVIGLIFVLIVLALATASIASAYSIVFQKYSELQKKHRKEGRESKAFEEMIESERLLLKEKMDQIVGKESGAFNDLLVSVKKEALLLMQDVGAEAKNEVRQDLARFTATLATRIDAELVKTQSELAAYKTKKMEEIDVRAKNVLKDALLNALPGLIDIDKHEELIMKSLQKAKEEKFF